MSSLTPEELREIRARHVEVHEPYYNNALCDDCVEIWPCDTTKLLDHIEGIGKPSTAQHVMTGVAALGLMDANDRADEANRRLTDALHAIIRCGDMDTAITLAMDALEGRRG